MIIGNSDSKEEPSDVAIFFLWNGSDLTIFINMFGLLELPAKYADIGGIWGDLYNNDLLWWLAALSPTHYMLILLWTCPGVAHMALTWLTSLNKKISILFILWIFMLQLWLLSNIRSYLPASATDIGISMSSYLAFCLLYLIQKLSDPKHEMLKCFHTILNIRPLKCQVIISA